MPTTERIREVIRRERIEAVVHFAASAYVGESMRDPRAYFRNNVDGTLSLLDAMLAEGVRSIVFSSTCATYGIPDRVPITEDEKQVPVNPYGESKLFVEKVLRWYGEAYGLRWAALRYFNAAGADPDGEVGEEHEPETHLIPLTIRAALGRGPALEIYGTDYPTPDGTAVRDYIHVVDLADAHLRALRLLAEGAEIGGLNLGTGIGHSVREVLAAVQQAAGRPVPVREGPRRAGDPPSLVADPARAMQLLGWQPRLAVAGRDRVDRSPLARERSRARHRLSAERGLEAVPDLPPPHRMGPCPRLPRHAIEGFPASCRSRRGRLSPSSRSRSSRPLSPLARSPFSTTSGPPWVVRRPRTRAAPS